MLPLDWIKQAHTRIAEYITITPLTYDSQRQLYFKWENQQRTGSFKARGALNKVLSLQTWERQAGLVAASAGNHGQGLALAGQLTGAAVEVFASAGASPAKLDGMRRLGAALRLVEGGYEQAESEAMAYARQHGKTWVSPYNDGAVIAGQGTLAIEALAQEASLINAAWIIPVGGGGLLSGVGAALRSLQNRTGSRPRIYGAQPVGSPFMHGLFYHGSQNGIVDHDSLADGLTGAVQVGSVTIPIVRACADEILLVSEAEIRDAVALAWQEYGQRIEGSAAVALAAAISERVSERPAVVVISGANISDSLHAHICQTAETR
jgi:threonine dehydratase